VHNTPLGKYLSGLPKVRIKASLKILWSNQIRIPKRIFEKLGRNEGKSH
jgi:hypothetical protein